MFKEILIFDPCDFEWPLTGSRVFGHLWARSLVIVTKFNQNWFMHLEDTLDNMVDRRRKKNLRETEYRRYSPV